MNRCREGGRPDLLLCSCQSTHPTHGDLFAPLTAPGTSKKAPSTRSGEYRIGRLLGSSHDTLSGPFGKRPDPVNQLLKLLSTSAAGALEVWVGIITGVTLGLFPALSGTVSVASALAGVTLVVAAGGRLRHLIYRSRTLAKRRERIERVWKRYGIPGVAALQAPLLTGPLLATLLALVLGAPPRPLLLLMLASVVFWGAALTGAAALGFSLFGL